MSCAKTAEPIEMPFGMWTRVGLENHALGGGHDPKVEGAIFFLGEGVIQIWSNFFDHLLILLFFSPPAQNL